MYRTTTKTGKSLWKTRLLLMLFFISTISTIRAQQLAFPGAEGGGRFAVGGRGGTVYEVTNLNDSGPGSLRDAISQPNRMVIFKVSGIIHLKSKLIFSKNNITVAGQTAPGDGICLTGYTVNIKASDIVIRYIRCRLSDVNNVEDDAMNSFSGPYQNIIIDHCSLGWSVDETGTFYGIKNFTLQWCLLSESLYRSVHDKGNHGYGGIWGGENATFHHNLLAHHTSRNPRFGGSRFTGRPDLEVVDFRNNVIYNWGNGNSAYGGEAGNYNMVNNYYKPGPATPGSLTTSSTNNKRNRILQYTSYYYGTDAAIYPDTVWGGKFYIDGNHVHGYPDVTADNWTKGVQKDNYSKAEQLIASARQLSPFPTAPVTTQTAEEAYASILQHVGATLPKRDAVDVRIIHEVQTGTATYEGATYGAITSTGISHPSGIIDTQADVGGLPLLNSTSPLTDKDHDGMPDQWEISKGLNPNDASDNHLIGANGYTNLENYLNSINGPTPNISTSGSVGNFIQNLGAPSSIQSYTVSAEGISGNLVIIPPSGYEISANGGASWYTNVSPLQIIPSDGIVLSTTISVRLNASSQGDYSGNIIHSSEGLTSVELAVSGFAKALVTPPTGTAVIVAKDGTGNYTTVQAAINAAPTGRTTPYIIFIKNGIYKEKINIPSNKPFIQLFGESVANTILTYDDYSGKAMPGGGTYGTSNSASVIVNAADFSAVHITFENSTGDAPQALAINVNADRASFKNCRFLGGQDTVLTNGAGRRQYFKNCYIDGVVDFIFGAASAVFDSCVIYPKSRKDLGKGGYVTAANTPVGQTYGYVFRNCVIPANTGVTSYVLGRPWQNSCGSSTVSHPKVVFLHTKMAHTIKPEGWAVWDACTNTNMIYYAEYKTTKTDGALADVSKRVPWSFQLTDAEANTYTNTNIFGDWDPCAAFGDCSSPRNVVVSNFKAKKGNTNTDFNWNISWPIDQVRYELFRSTDKVSFTKVNDQISVHDTTINFHCNDAIPGPGVTFYYFLKASKPGSDPHLTDTIQISSTPTILSSGSLGSFLQGVGLPSSAQVYTVSGTSLTDNVSIKPPVGYELAVEGDTAWIKNPSSITLTHTAGTLSPTTLKVRLNSEIPGAYSGDIIHTTFGADTVKIAISGNVQSEPLPVSETLIYWPMVSNNNDSSTFRSPAISVGAVSLSRLYPADGIAAAPYSSSLGQVLSASANGDGTWTTASGGPGGNLSRTLYEQFTISAKPGYTVKLDSFLLKSSFILTQSNTKMAVVYSRSGFVSDSSDVSGGIGPDGSLLNSANGAFSTPILLTNENSATTKNYKLAFAGSSGVTITGNQTLTIRVYFSCGSTSPGRYAKVKDVTIKGSAKAAANMAISGTLDSFTQILGTPSAVQTYKLSANGLVDNLTITPPSHFEVSSDGGTNWFSNSIALSLTSVNGKIDTTLLSVRLNANAPESYSGNIVHASSGVEAVVKAVSGTSVNPPAQITVNGALSLFKQKVGTPSSIQTYSISGKYLTGNLTVKPPVNYQVSPNGVNWYSNASPLVLTPVNGAIPATTISVRLSASSIGNYLGNIVHSSGGASTIEVPLSGISYSKTGEQIIVSGSLKTFNQTVGKPSDVQTYSVSGVNLSANIAIKTSKYFEVSANGGTTWHTSTSPLTLPKTNGTVAPTMISVRLNASYTGYYYGKIINTSKRAATINLSVFGIASKSNARALEEEGEIRISISPNPVENTLVLHHPVIDSEAKVFIYNISGLKQISFNVNSGIDHSDFDITSLKMGEYLLEYLNETEKKVLRFIKK